MIEGCPSNSNSVRHPRRSLLSVCFLFALAVGWSAAASPKGLVKKAPGLPGSVQSFFATVDSKAYPELDESGNEIGMVDWRVVGRTGNCCESYLAVTESGRLVDLGGDYPRFTDDRGLSWTEVNEGTGVLYGEGAVSGAPGGDIVGIGWYPYQGDRTIAYKWDASTDEWEYAETLHTPFYDRPWIAVIPGPFAVAGSSVPYITIVKGGWPTKEVWLYSFDGLNYEQVTSKEIELLVSPSGPDTIATTSFAEADWVQPNVEAGVAPIGGGWAIADHDHTEIGSSCSGRMLFSPQRTWSCAGTDVEGRVLVDSKGRLNSVVDTGGGFRYRVKIGSEWKERFVAYPPGYSARFFDFKVNGDLGVGAVIVHAYGGDGMGRDFLYKLEISDAGPSLDHIYALGDGETSFIQGVGTETIDCFLGVKSCPRFDFSSVAILPDGKLAASFGGDPSPLVAIEP